MDIVFEDTDLLVIDDFLANPDKVRSKGLHAPFGDYPGMDGQTYKRVAVGPIPDVVDALNKAMGRPIQLLGMGYRLNYAGETPNNEIHADLGWGTYAAVVYLAEPPNAQPSGTAFWQHETGPDRITVGQLDVFNAVQGDWNDASKWEQTRYVSCKYNSAIIYRSELFHSRWPFEAFGSTPADGRLTVVAFFS